MNILVATDLSESTQQVLEGMEALLDVGNARVWLIHVAEPKPWFVGHEVDTREMREVTAEMYQREHRELQRIGAELRSKGVDCSSLLVQGETAGMIMDEADRLSVDVIVLGSHGKSAVKRWVVGSTSDDVLRHSSIPVLVIPTHRDPEANR
ncbi:MAG: universal stress protein [Pseudomonadota bacterium]|nr:universal stress protein [Pseudomonadota bacterium]